MATKYSGLLNRATKGVAYWSQRAMRQFVSDLVERMERRDMTNAKLAESIGVSPAYVSKVLHGDVNFTLETMTKLAMAVGSRVEVNFVPLVSEAPAARQPLKIVEVGRFATVRQASSTASGTVELSAAHVAANEAVLHEVLRPRLTLVSASR